MSLDTRNIEVINIINIIINIQGVSLARKREFVILTAEFYPPLWSFFKIYDKYLNLFRKYILKSMLNCINSTIKNGLRCSVINCDNYQNRDKIRITDLS